MQKKTAHLPMKNKLQSETSMETDLLEAQVAKHENTIPVSLKCIWHFLEHTYLLSKYCLIADSLDTNCQPQKATEGWPSKK